MGVNVSNNTPNVPDIEFMTDKLLALCRIPSPSGDTEEAILWTKAQFEELGYTATVTNKGGLLVRFREGFPGWREAFRPI